jgi:hypothetical protein
MHVAVGPILSDLGNGASIVIVAGGVFGIYRAVAGVYNRTVGSRRDLARRLNQLAAGVTLCYVEERFGSPTFARTITFPRRPPEEEQTRPETRSLKGLARTFIGADAPISLSQAADSAPGAGQTFRELVYREKHAWIQVLADEDDAVARFSITVTDPRFRFSARNLTWGRLPVRLGRSRFSDVPADAFPDGRSLRIGAHNHEYAESYWFGNPGNYQRYVLSSNEIGTGGFGYSILREAPPVHQSGTLAHCHPVPASQSPFDPDAPYTSAFRSQTTINTLTVLGPRQWPTDLAEPRGPDSNHVRVLAPQGRERWRIRRRLRRLGKQIAARKDAA